MMISTEKFVNLISKNCCIRIDNKKIQIKNNVLCQRLQLLHHDYLRRKASAVNAGEIFWKYKYNSKKRKFVKTLNESRSR